MAPPTRHVRGARATNKGNSGDKMLWRGKLGRWCTRLAVVVFVAALPLLAQRDRRQERPAARPPENRVEHRNAPQQRREARPEFRQQAPRPGPRNVPREASPPPAAARDYPRYQPPTQGHHFGQWLNRHRDQPLEQQRQALQRDPAFRRLPRARQQEYMQRLQRFNNMPPERQQQVLRRMETWEHLTPQQKQEFQGFRSQFNGLPPDRRRAVRNAIETLRAMPPDARQREIQSGRFSQFSPQERQLLNDAARLPLAPAEPQGAAESNQNQNVPPARYVPRPPRQ